MKLGKLKFILHGTKLKGEYALVKAHGRGENGWLLFKVNDEYASKDDITKKDKSVISKKTLEQVEKTTSNFYGVQRVKEASTKSKKEISLNKRSDVKTASLKNVKEKSLNGEISNKGERAKFPVKLLPMFATL